MQAVIFAAGMGKRLAASTRNLPKILIRIGEQSLLERHLNQLLEQGISNITIGVGFGSDLIKKELNRIGRTDVKLVYNPNYHDGSIVTLHCLKEAITYGGEVVIMDGDVLYDRRILNRLFSSNYKNTFLLDRNFEMGEEPMKLAIKDGRPVDFKKTIEKKYDYCGESVGFFRFSHDTTIDITEDAENIIYSGHRNEYMEESIRNVLISSPPNRFGFEDITGLPWIEIDFAEDIARAKREILPNLQE